MFDRFYIPILLYKWFGIQGQLEIQSIKMPPEDPADSTKASTSSRQYGQETQLWSKFIYYFMTISKLIK